MTPRKASAKQKRKQTGSEAREKASCAGITVIRQMEARSVSLLQAESQKGNGRKENTKIEKEKKTVSGAN